MHGDSCPDGNVGTNIKKTTKKKNNINKNKKNEENEQQPTQSSLSTDLRDREKKIRKKEDELRAKTAELNDCSRELAKAKATILNLENKMKETESQISTMSKCIEDLRNREKNPSHIHQTKPTTSCNHHMADDHNQLGLLHLKRLDTIIYLLQQNPTMPSTPS